MPVPITSDQAAALQAKVSTLLADKATADQATQSSNDAGAALVAAQTADANAKIAEASADGQVNTDLQDLLAFVSSLTGTQLTTTPPAPPAPTPPSS